MGLERAVLVHFRWCQVRNFGRNLANNRNPVRFYVQPTKVPDKPATFLGTLALVQQQLIPRPFHSTFSRKCPYSQSSPNSEMDDYYRLPKTVRPISFDLQLFPDLELGLFTGKIRIKVDVLEDVKEIRLHAKGLALIKAHIDGREDTFTEVKDKYELFIIKLPLLEMIKKGERVLDIQYSGDMKNRIVGLYVSKYIDQKGENSSSRAAMTVTNGSARFHRRNNSSPSAANSNGNAAPNTKPKQRTRTCYPILLSCCLFFTILCACLFAALVLIGKHLYQNKIDILGDLRHRQESGDNSSEAAVPPPKRAVPARLPNDTLPLHYDLTLVPDVESGSFKGKTNITLVLERTRRNILVHGKDLSIDGVDLFYVNGSRGVDVQNIEEIGGSEMISVLPKEELQPGLYYLHFEFSGNMLNKTKGIYRSQYRNESDGEVRSIATSKFEPTYARQAYPCFDEPNMKAKFTVHILKPKDDPSYIALSNMPETGQEVQDNGVMVHFKESVKMSTYLSCFIVCDFKHTENVIQKPGRADVPLRVYATPAQLEKTKLAAEVGVGVIKYFIDYFDIDYPLPKLDLIAIPDFVSGAMEHWGLVTFRETALLYDRNTSSSPNKQRVATVIAHELAHSWFGNLVTMDWWNDLWLNEGFASYIEYKGVDAVFKDWQMLDQFLLEDLHPVLSLDATPASHPIVQTVLTPDQITELFDSITYNKGASILRMLDNAVGEKTFQAGVTNYLKAHQWGNAVTQDLWDELQKIVGGSLNITDFMNTWTVQMGYPIVTVEEEGDNYVLSQKRFLKDPEQPGNKPSPYNYRWTIPVTYITDVNPTKPDLVWFEHNKTGISIPKPAGSKWIKFNHKQTGYYRVNYNQAQWLILADNIKNMESPSDRTHLIEESFSIAETGELDYSIPLNLTKYLKDELDYVPWSVAASKLGGLRKYLISSLEYSNYVDYVLSIVSPVYENLTWQEEPEDSHLTRLARSTVFELACSMGHSECRQEAQERFKLWLEDPEGNPVSQDLRTIVYKYGMAESGKNEWEKLLEIFKKEIDANEKIKLLRGLTAVKEPWLLRRLIELGKNDQIIRSQDYFIMLEYIAGNPVGTAIVWDYIRENWQFLVDRFTLNSRILGRMIPNITGSFITAVKLKEIEAFFAAYPEAGAGKLGREQALANVRNNIKWVSKNREIVEKWIRENSGT